MASKSTGKPSSFQAKFMHILIAQGKPIYTAGNFLHRLYFVPAWHAQRSTNLANPLGLSEKAGRKFL